MQTTQNSLIINTTIRSEIVKLDHYNILVCGVTFWNNWRLKNPNIRPDLSEANVDGIDLSYFDFSNTSFAGANISRSSFRNAMLSSTSFEGANIENSSFDECRFSKTDLQKAKISDSTFVDANLREVDLRESMISGCYFNGSTISHSNLQNSKISDCRFHGTHIYETTFFRSVLIDLFFIGGRLNSVKLVKAQIANVVFKKTNLHSIDLTESLIDNLQATNSHLEGCTFVNSNFTLKLEEWEIDSPYFLFEEFEYHDHYRYRAPASFRHSTLTDCNFLKANLGGISFSNSDQSYSTFIDSKMKLTDLSFCKLDHCTFQGANLNKTVLEETDFFHCEFGNSQLTELDFSKSKNLETIDHKGPSSVDYKTLSKSPNLDLDFLRGLGLTDWEIEAIQLYNPSLSLSSINDTIYKIFDYRSEQPLQFHSCFISHSSSDKSFARTIYRDLQNNGVRCWYAPEELKGGQKMDQQINEAIHLHEKFIIILSDESIKSDWVKYELRKGILRERKENNQILFPVSLIPFERLKNWELFDNSLGIDLADKVREYYIPFFDNWNNHESYQKTFNKFLNNLRSKSTL